MLKNSSLGKWNKNHFAPTKIPMRLLGIYLKESICLHKDLHTWMFMVALFITAPSWEQLKFLKKKKKKKKKIIKNWYTLQPGRILNVLLSERSQAVCCCSAAQLCLTLCDRTDCSMTGFSVFHYCLEFAQTHVPWVSDAIQPSHLLSFLYPPAFNFSQHQGLFQWVSSLHQVAKALELQLQHQSFQRIFRTDFL